MPSFDFQLYCAEHLTLLRTTEEEYDEIRGSYALNLPPCPDCIEEAKSTCAAGPWCFDIEAAPENSSKGILLLDADGDLWLGFEKEMWPTTPVAWAEIRLPKEKT